MEEIVENRLRLVKSVGDLFTAQFLTKDLAEANLLKRAILSEIETYCIDIVSFNVNNSARHDEIIALRLGQLVIDHTKFNPPNNEDLVVTVNVEDKEFTSDDIRGIPFACKTPIIPLRRGERINCQVTVRKGQGKIHVKWRPVYKVIIKEAEDSIYLTIGSIGMMNPIDIFREGYNKMSEAATRPPINLYFKPAIPLYMLEEAIQNIERED